MGFIFDYDDILGKSALLQIKSTYDLEESKFNLEKGINRSGSLDVISNISDKNIITKIKNTRNENTEYYLRLKVFMPENCNAIFGGSNKWTPGTDEYFYYSDILRNGESTEEFNTALDIYDLLYQYKQDFNIIIVAECVEVQYHEDGTPYADWDYTSP